MAVIRAAALQMNVGSNRSENVRTAKEYVDQAMKNDPDFVMLPEMFCCPYETKQFPLYAEEEGGEIYDALSSWASHYGIYLIAGSIPEKDQEGYVYNTSYVFDRSGKKIAKHRKVHLFDVAIQRGQHFQESKTLKAGTEDTIFDTEYGRMAVIICFDIRFPEMVRRPALCGAKVVFVPAAFNMTTGPAHWELTFRARALDNQLYLMGCAPARSTNSSYISWGHSLCTNPWGTVVGELNEKEGILFVTMDLSYEDEVRQQLPLLSGCQQELEKKVDENKAHP